MNKLGTKMLALPRPAKRALALGVDAALCSVTVWLALCLRLESWVWPSGGQWVAVGLAPLVALPLFSIFGLYRAIFRYAGMSAMAAIVKAVVVYGLVFGLLLVALALPGVPRTLGVLQPILLLLTVGASRAIARYLLTGIYLTKVSVFILTGKAPANP